MPMHVEYDIENGDAVFHSVTLERPPLAVLQFIGPHEVRPEHVALLQKLEPYMLDGYTAKQMGLALFVGAMWMWDVGGEGKAVVLTTIMDGADRALHVDGAVGSGIIAASPAIAADLRTIAREYNCKRITATSKRDGWLPSANALGFVPVSTNYRMEVDDGLEAAV